MIKAQPNSDGWIESKAEEGFTITEKVIVEKTVDVDLDDEIKSGDNYFKIESVLRSLGQSDVVNFRIGSYGGCCHGLIHLISAIKSCRAKEINMIVVSPSYSAAATLALVGTSLKLEDHTFLMYHNYSGGNRGKGGELVKSVLEQDRWLKNYMYDLHTPFMDDTEAALMEKDQDVYIHFNTKDLAKRIKRHFDYHNKIRNAKLFPKQLDKKT